MRASESKIAVKRAGVLDGRQQHKSPETKVGVAGLSGGRLEPEDEGRSQESPEIPDGPLMARDSLTWITTRPPPAGESSVTRARARASRTREAREKNPWDVELDPCRGE